jgi:hypothetical protein
MFAVAKLDFPVHCISTADVTPLQDNAQVILDFPKPNDCKALQRFLGVRHRPDRIGLHDKPQLA